MMVWLMHDKYAAKVLKGLAFHRKAVLKQNEGRWDRNKKDIWLSHSEKFKMLVSAIVK